MPNSKIFKHSSAIVDRINNDKTVSIMRLDEEDCFYHIDGIASRVWTMINGKNTIESIIEKISAKDASLSKKLKKDVPKFILDLKKKKLIEPVKLK